jgi:hypothetical protein
LYVFVGFKLYVSRLIPIECDLYSNNTRQFFSPQVLFVSISQVDLPLRAFQPLSLMLRPNVFYKLREVHLIGLAMANLDAKLIALWG